MGSVVTYIHIWDGWEHLDLLRRHYTVIVPVWHI